MLEELERDAKPMKRCEEKTIGRGTGHATQRCRTWRISRGGMRTARRYKATAGVGCDGFHPKVPLDVSQETRGEVVKLLKARRQKCDVRFSAVKRSRVFQKNHKRIGVRKLLRWSMVLERWALRPQGIEVVKTTPPKTRFRSVNLHKEFAYRSKIE